MIILEYKTYPSIYGTYNVDGSYSISFSILVEVFWWYEMIRDVHFGNNILPVILILYWRVSLFYLIIVALCVLV